MKREGIDDKKNGKNGIWNPQHQIPLFIKTRSSARPAKGMGFFLKNCKKKLINK